VKPGQKVAAGQPLCRADFKKIRVAGLCESVILLITEKTVPGEVKIQKGIVRGGKDIALRIEK
jgi:phosphotransferase system IIA component